MKNMDYNKIAEEFIKDNRFPFGSPLEVIREFARHLTTLEQLEGGKPKPPNRVGVCKHGFSLCEDCDFSPLAKPKLDKQEIMKKFDEVIEDLKSWINS